MWAACSELCFGEPELADGYDAGEFELVLPDVVVEIAAVIAATAGAAAGNDALRYKMKWARAKRTCSAIENGLFSKIVDHIGAVAFPVGPIVGTGNSGIGRPHGRIRGRVAESDLSEERCA